LFVLHNIGQLTGKKWGKKKNSKELGYQLWYHVKTEKEKICQYFIE
jgi:hypothetical protein